MFIIKLIIHEIKASNSLQMQKEVDKFGSAII